MKNELVSIIVPVYNSEKYLCECIDSLLRQTYNNIQILLIDDGSDDSSAKICEHYQNTDSRIIVICKKNGGVASARNCGLDAATGEYILFADADDYADANWCQAYVAEIQGKDYAIGVTKGVNDGNIAFTDKYRCASEKTIPFLKELLKNDWSLACNEGIFRKEILDKNCLKFTFGRKTGEDQEFVYKYLMSSNRIGYTDDAIYYYRINNQSSVMHQKNYHHYDAVEAMLALSSYAELHLDSQNAFAVESGLKNHKIPQILTFATLLLLSAGESVPQLYSFLKDKGYDLLLNDAVVEKEKGYSNFVRIWQISPIFCLRVYALRKATGRILRRIGILK